MATALQLMTLADSQDFKTRVKFFLFKAARAAAQDDPASTNYADRLKLARRVFMDQVEVGYVCIAAVTHSTVSALADPDAVTDAQLDTVVTEIYNALAR